MKKSLLVIAITLFSLIAVAQKQDNKIYGSCSTSLRKEPVSDYGNEIVFDSCPEFPGGVKALNKYLAIHVHYPRDEDVSGKVYVKFVVEKDGRITNVILERGLTKETNKEALRVIKGFPKWKPAILKGKPVSAYYTIPINFTIYG